MRVFMTLVVACGVFGLAGAAGAEQRYTDTLGDSGNARDLTQVVVSNDAAQVTFAIATPAQPPAWDEGEALEIDKDGNPSTGDEGSDIRVWMSPESVEAWNGSDWVEAPTSGVTNRLDGSGLWRVVIPRTLLGGGTVLDFNLWSVKINGLFSACCDFAPDGGTWRYELVLKQCANGRDDDGDGKVDTSDLGCSGAEDDLESDDPYTLAIGRPTVSPASGHVGQPITVTARVRRVETGQPIAAGVVHCTTTVGSTTKWTTGKLAAGVASCRVTAPRVAEQSVVRGRIAVASRGALASAAFSFRTS
jgi:hypothetical protein